MAKAVVEAHDAVSIADLRRFGFLKRGWESIGGRTSRLPGGDWVGFGWDSERAVTIIWPGMAETEVALAYTRCHFGGSRPWFMCPRCRRRVGVLYVVALAFMCRRCADLTYQTQTEQPLGRAMLRAQRLRERFGGSPSLTQPFPSRPRWMHQRTYERLLARVGAYNAAAVGAMQSSLDLLRQNQQSLLP
jgi:hypothetical protein